jgi:hypothetical protein
MSDSGKRYTDRPPIESNNMHYFKGLRSLNGVAHDLAYLD